MRRFLANRWFLVGVVLVAVGWSPLLIVGLLAELGLWPDPNPNPIGLGLLFFVTSWPAIICLAVGFFQVKARDRRSMDAPSVDAPAENREGMLRALASAVPSRIVIGIAGMWLAAGGVRGLMQGVKETRGAAAAIVIGGAMVWWGVAGDLPEWLTPRLRWRRRDASRWFE